MSNVGLGEPFQGELMHCVICDREFISIPNVNQGWSAIQMRGELLYACPEHTPHTLKGAQRTLAFQKIFEAARLQPSAVLTVSGTLAAIAATR